MMYVSFKDVCILCMYVHIVSAKTPPLCQVYLLSLQFTTDFSSLSTTVSFALVTNSRLPEIAGPHASSLTMIHILD